MPAIRTERFGPHTLILGDSKELLLTERAKHILTDPPYEDEMHAGVGKIARLRNDGGTINDDLNFDGINADRDEFAKLMVEASDGWLLAFSLAEGVRAWRDPIQAAGGKWDTTCIWVKPDSTPRMNGQGPARGFENFVLAWCGPGLKKWNAGGKRGVYVHMVNPPSRVPAHKGGHPTEKPLGLMRELVMDFTQPGETVLDPFMGSGTTGVACALTGRVFTGIEQTEKWFDLACRRMEAAHAQGAGLFSGENAYRKRQQARLDEEWPRQAPPKRKGPAAPPEAATEPLDVPVAD